jgi:hypothetical protein
MPRPNMHVKCTNMQLGNMQKYAEICRNMQEICKYFMQGLRLVTVLFEFFENMQDHHPAKMYARILHDTEYASTEGLHMQYMASICYMQKYASPTLLMASARPTATPGARIPVPPGPAGAAGGRGRPGTRRRRRPRSELDLGPARGPGPVVAAGTDNR